MFLFIFESIGTSELLLIGVIALIFLGPRKLPQIARTIGKAMAEFRSTTNEFKATWEREVNFEEETNALRSSAAEEPTVPRAQAVSSANAALPEVKQIDAAAFESSAVKTETAHTPKPPETADKPAAEFDPDEAASDKRSWL